MSNCNQYTAFFYPAGCPYRYFTDTIRSEYAHLAKSKTLLLTGSSWTGCTFIFYPI